MGRGNRFAPQTPFRSQQPAAQGSWQQRGWIKIVSLPKCINTSHRVWFVFGIPFAEVEIKSGFVGDNYVVTKAGVLIYDARTVPAFNNRAFGQALGGHIIPNHGAPPFGSQKTRHSGGEIIMELRRRPMSLSHDLLRRRIVFPYLHGLRGNFIPTEMNISTWEQIH